MTDFTFRLGESMAVVSTLEPPATQLPRVVAEEPLYEIVDGKLVELPPMSILAVRIVGRLYSRMDAFAEAHSLGTAVIEALFILDAIRNLRRRPDVAFVSKLRWPLDRPLPEEGDWEVIPDLAIEVVSPNDLFAEVLAKKNEYFRLGVQQVWVVEPASNEVHVFETATECRILKIDKELDGGLLLPGFHIPLAALFNRQAVLSETPVQ
jgi:Uma2 family endonuclease